MGIICQHGQKEGMHNENLKRLNCCMFKIQNKVDNHVNKGRVQPI
jgi:hypothetical protein